MNPIIISNWGQFTKFCYIFFWLFLKYYLCLKYFPQLLAIMPIFKANFFCKIHLKKTFNKFLLKLRIINKRFYKKKYFKCGHVLAFSARVLNIKHKNKSKILCYFFFQQLIMVGLNYAWIWIVFILFLLKSHKNCIQNTL